MFRKHYFDVSPPSRILVWDGNNFIYNRLMSKLTHCSKQTVFLVHLLNYRFTYNHRRNWISRKQDRSWREEWIIPYIPYASLRIERDDKLLSASDRSPTRVSLVSTNPQTTSLTFIHWTGKKFRNTSRFMYRRFVLVVGAPREQLPWRNRAIELHSMKFGNIHYTPGP